MEYHKSLKFTNIIYVEKYYAFYAPFKRKCCFLFKTVIFHIPNSLEILMKIWRKKKRYSYNTHIHTRACTHTKSITVTVISDVWKVMVAKRDFRLLTDTDTHVKEIRLSFLKNFKAAPFSSSTF